MKRSFNYSTLVFVLLPTGAFAGGFNLPQASYANAGTAGAGDGVYTQSAASVWANPAINSFIEDDIFTVNGLAFDLSNKYYDATDSSKNSGESGSLMGAGGLFYTKNINEQWSAGLALATLGGSALDYGNQWSGRGQVTDVSIMSMQFNPSVSYKVNEQFSIGGGIQADYAAFETSMFPGLSSDTSGDWAFGYNLGMVYQFNQDTIAGLSYRSKVEHQFDGHLHSPVGVIPPTFSTGIDFVATARADISHALNPDLKLLGSITWSQWSDLDQTPVRIGGLQPQDIDRNWNDTWTYAVGVDYRLNDKTRLKFGISYETSPLKDAQYQTPDLPVDRQIRYSAGVSTFINQVPVDFFYEYADLGSPQIAQSKQPINNLNGYFDMKAHFIGFAVHF